MQYQYHVEFLEPATPWKSQDSKLATKNVHGVPLASIKNMKSKFENGVSCDDIIKTLGLKPVLVPKKRNIPKTIPLPSSMMSLVDDFDPLSLSRNVEPKPGPSGFQPIVSSDEADSRVPNSNEWQLRSQNNWNEVYPVPGPKQPSPDSTTPDISEAIAVTPKGKNRKNKKNKGGNSSKLVPHRKNCPNENKEFSQVRELYPAVNDTYLWDLFERCQGDPNWTVDILIDENKSDQMTSGKQLSCTCFTVEDPKQVEVKRKNHIPKKQLAVPSSTKKTKQGDYDEWLDTKAAIEQSIKFATEHYPEHVNKVKDWKKPQVPVEEAMEPQKEVNYPDIGDELHSLTISEELIHELDEEYGGGLLKHRMSGKDTKFPSKIFVKKSVAHQLYCEIMECFYSREEEMRLENLQKDEELAKALNEQEEKDAATPKTGKKKTIREREREFLNELHNARVDDWQTDDSSEELLARKIAKDKLFELFPDTNRDFLVEIWKSNDYDFQETVDSVKDSYFCSVEERDRIAKNQKAIINRPWKQTPMAEPESSTSDQAEGYTSEQLKTVEDLRQEIADHIEEKKVCRIKSEEAIRARNFELSTYYAHIAAFHKSKGDEKAHEVANLMAGIHEKTQGNSKTIDLVSFFLQSPRPLLITLSISAFPELNRIPSVFGQIS